MKLSKRKITDNLFFFIMFIGMLIFSISFVFILLWILINSFRTPGAFSDEPFALFNFAEYTFESYQRSFGLKIGRNEMTILKMTGNSLILTLGQTFLACTIPAITGYVTAKYKFKLKRVIVNVVIGTMVVPAIGAVSSTYKFLNFTGLHDTFAGIFLMGSGGFGMGFLLFYNFFGSVPWEYAESAFIDGASNFKVFYKIMYPQAKGIVTSIAIMTFIMQWNDYFTPYMYLPSRPTVALGVDIIYKTFVQSGMDYPAVFSVMVFTVGVVLLLYTVFSKTITESMSVGGLKA